MAWTPATKQDVEAAIDAGWDGIDPDLRIRLSAYLVDPSPALIERFGQSETAFVVARAGRNVVFFDDIELDFGTATETAGKLSNVASYGNIALAMSELERLGPNVR